MYPAPCTKKNTAFLGLQHSRIPKERIVCLDIKSLGGYIIPSYIDKIETSRVLYADHMLLKIVPIFLTEVLPELEYIDLTGNNIKHIDPYTFQKNKNLTTLILSDNKVHITKRHPLIRHSHLTQLYLSKNKIKHLRIVTFHGLPELTTLYLDGNRLVSINPKVFASLKKLNFLHLGNNQLKKLPPKDQLPTSLLTYITKGNPLNITVTSN